MRYTVIITSSAQKSIERLAATDAARVIQAIDALATNPRPTGCIKLSGREEWRVRVGDIRILYTIDDPQLRVDVVRVSRRDKAYR